MRNCDDTGAGAVGFHAKPGCRGALATLPLTRHACKRQASRAIPPLVIDWLLDLGRWTHGSGGADIVCFDAPARRQVRREVGPKHYARYERVLSTAYAVVGADGAVITVGHRTRRLRRH